MRLLASDLQRVDITQLDPDALSNIKQLSVSLVPCPYLGGLQELFVFWVWANALHLTIVLPSFPQGILTYPTYLAAVLSLSKVEFCSVHSRVPASFR